MEVRRIYKAIFDDRIRVHCYDAPLEDFSEIRGRVEVETEFTYRRGHWIMRWEYTSGITV